MPNPNHVVLAFWRPDGQGAVEFFIPLDGDYLEFMRCLIVDESAARTARRLAQLRFELNPRGNVRIFRVEDAWVAAFSLNILEAATIGVEGAWLPAHLIMDGTVADILQDVAGRL